jgi:hypothetical protein
LWSSSGGTWLVTTWDLACHPYYIFSTTAQEL